MHDGGHRKMKASKKTFVTGEALEELYRMVHRRAFVHPDPLEFLYEYSELPDREIVGLVASSLAYGKVGQILQSISLVLNRMKPSPSHFLINSSWDEMKCTFSDFRHRFTTGGDITWLLRGAKRIIEDYGSLHQCFASGLRDQDDTVIPALTAFVKVFQEQLPGCRVGFFPTPRSGSACKRLHLFLRWMVRRDEVDPGGWDLVPASKLIVPLDTHMHRMGLALGLTTRKQADLQTATEITSAFRKVAPHDPVRYDFALTRLGIRNDLNPQEFFAACGIA
jgi:uncharacterized protein (TIGR02757 family)